MGASVGAVPTDAIFATRAARVRRAHVFNVWNEKATSKLVLKRRLDDCVVSRVYRGDEGE